MTKVEPFTLIGKRFERERHHSRAFKRLKRHMVTKEERDHRC